MATAEDLARNSFNVAVARVLVMFAVFGTSLMTARWLGPHGRGQYSLATLVATLAAMLVAFVGPGATYHAARGTFARAQVLGSTVVLSIGWGVVAALLGAAVLLPLRGGLVAGVPGAYIAIGLASIPFGVVVVNVVSVLRGWERYRPMNAVLVAQAAVPLLFLTPFVALDVGHVWAAVLTTSAATAVVAALGIDWGRRAAGGIDLHVHRPYTRDATRYGLRAYPGAVITFLAYRLDVFLVNGFLDPAAVGLYSIAVVTAERVWTVSEASSVVLFPRIAAEADAEERDRLTAAVSRSVLWMTALIALAVFAISHWLVVGLYGRQFAGAVTTLQILLPGMVLSAPARVVSTDIAARGRPLVTTYSGVLVLALNVVLNVVLLPREGLEGAAIACSASYAAGAVALFAIYLGSSRASLSSLLVPRRSDFVALRRIAASIVA